MVCLFDSPQMVLMQINSEPFIFTGMKIGFLYYKFFPVEGGAAIHGYHLARELSLLGYDLYKLNGEKDPYTKKLNNPVTGFLWMLARCDLIYVRMDYFLKPRNLLAVLALLFRKRVFVELNAPSDELYLYGRTPAYIRRVDRIMAHILKRADTIVVVSEPLKQYCTQALRLNNVAVVENGADRFETKPGDVSKEIIEQLNHIKTRWPKLVVWPGSTNKMQNLEDLKNLARKAQEKAAFLIIAKEEPGEHLQDMDEPNVFVWKGLARAEVEYIIKEADIGIALYEDYDWSRWGFYNSSLKTFEYLSNGLLTISNKKGTGIQQKNHNFRFAGNPDEMLTFMDEEPSDTGTDHSYRTWKHVASDISNLIHRSETA